MPREIISDKEEIKDIMRQNKVNKAKRDKQESNSLRKKLRNLSRFTIDEIEDYLYDSEE